MHFSRRSPTRSRRRRRGVHRFRKVPDAGAQGSHGRQPAQSDREGAHPCGAGPEVLRRQRAQVGRQGRLSPRHRSSSEGAAFVIPRVDLRRMATVAVTHFSDRLAAAVERKRSQLVVGLDPVVEQLPRRGRRRSARVLLRDRRRGRAVCGRSEAAVGVLRGARRRRRACVRRDVRVRARRRPARDRRREARRHRLDRPRVRDGVHPARRRCHRQPVPRRRLDRRRSSTRAGAKAPASSAS